MKIKLEYNPKAEPPYLHMERIVDALLERGNELSRDCRWHNGMASKECLLTQPIDFDWIETHFDLPANIRLTKERNAIECDETWTTIQGTDE